MARTDDSNLIENDANARVLLHKDGFSLKDYRKIARLGEGTFGEVWKAERGGFTVALKILKASMSSDETQRELKSLETLRELHHAFLLHTENFWSDGERLYIEMELADGGTLKERLKAYQAAGREGIPAEELLKFFTESAKALDYLHGHRPVFLHRDIKPANILLVKGAAKLADFGLLRQVTGDNTSTKTQGGTPVYMAPESIKEDKFSVLTDLFSFAVTYAELRQGKLPFYAKTQFHIYQKICQDPPELTDVFHPEEKKVLLKALEKEPGHRYSSCGEFVFELNRVVPWVAASAIPELHSAGADRLPEETIGDAPPADQPAEAGPEFGTARKKSPITMPEFGPLPATSAPATARGEDGTVVTERGARPPKPLPGATKTDNPAKPPLAESHGATTLPPAAEKQARSFADAHARIRKRTIRRVFALALFAALISGAGFLGYLAWHGDGEPAPPGPNGNPPRQELAPDEIAARVNQALGNGDLAAARDVVQQNKASLPDGGTELTARIERKARAATLLDRAADLRNKKDFSACLNLLATSKVTFDFQSDLDRKTRIYESARDQLHLRIVNDVRTRYQAGNLPGTRDALVALRAFRREYPKADWSPEFQEANLAGDTLTQAWMPFLAETVVVADCQQALKKLREFGGPANGNVLVLDPLYEPNARALDALLQAHEKGGKAVGAAIGILRASPPPGDLNRDLWLGLERLDSNRKSIRFEDLESLPAAPADKQAMKASAAIFAHVLERRITADNHRWLPNKAERDQSLAWIDQRIADPTPWVRALKAECLVLAKAELTAINQVKLPLKGEADWYGSYVRAVVSHANAAAAKDQQKHEEAAEILFAVLTKEPRVVANPGERAAQASRILGSAVAILSRKKAAAHEFTAPADAGKAVRWLMLILNLEPMGAPVASLDQCVDLAFAAVQSEDARAGEILKTVATRLDRMPEPDKTAGYALLAKAYHLDLDIATAKLAQAPANKTLWDQAEVKSKRAQDFAYDARNVNPAETSADLNAKGADLEAWAAFAKSQKNQQTKYDVFVAAFQRTKKLDPKKRADTFRLPLLVVKLEAVKDFQKEDIRTTIDAARTELKASMPKTDWWQTRRGRAQARFGDAHFVLFLRMTAAKEEIGEGELKATIKEMLDSYLEAKNAGKYQERYAGELASRIGRAYFQLKDYPKARVVLPDAKAGLSTLKRPYPAALREDIELAVGGVDYFLGELKKLDSQK